MKESMLKISWTNDRP